MNKDQLATRLHYFMELAAKGDVPSGCDVEKLFAYIDKTLKLGTQQR
jgi:hypothetical protein